MNKLITLFFIFCSYILVAQPVQLKNFEEIMAALNSGEQVRAVFQYNKCQLIRDNTIQEKIIEAVGGMNIDAYEYFAANTAGKKAFVVFSTSKFIMNPVDDGYVYNYVKVKITEENKVIITAQYVKPNTLEVTMDDKFFTDVSDGKNEKAGAFFYKQK